MNSIYKLTMIVIITSLYGCMAKQDIFDCYIDQYKPFDHQVYFVTNDSVAYIINEKFGMKKYDITGNIAKVKADKYNECFIEGYSVKKFETDSLEIRIFDVSDIVVNDFYYRAIKPWHLKININGYNYEAHDSCFKIPSNQFKNIDTLEISSTEYKFVPILKIPYTNQIGKISIVVAKSTKNIFYNDFFIIENNYDNIVIGYMNGKGTVEELKMSRCECREEIEKIITLQK